MQTRSIQKTVRDLLIILFSVSGAAWLYRMLHSKPLVRVVVFHTIEDAVWFESMIRTLVESFHVVSPKDFHVQSFAQNKINILITFDDGYASWCTHALPILEKYQCKGLFFINSGLVDVAHEPEHAEKFMKENLYLTPKKALSWEDVQVLLKAGHVIGGHTRSHIHMGKVSIEEMAREVSDDKQSIEEHTGTHVTDFAYPFGTKHHVNETAKEQVEIAGYTRGYTAISRFVSHGNLYTIPRMCIETGTSPRSLRRWVGGAYDLFDILKNLCVR